MPTLEDLLQGLPTGSEALWASIVPFFAALFLGASGVRARRPLRSGAVGASLALFVGYLAAHVSLWGAPPIPPILAADWLPLIAVLTLSASLWSETRERIGRLGLGIHLTTAVAAAGLTIRPRILAARWEADEAALQALLLGGPLLAAWLLIGRGARSRPARECLTVLLLMAGATSIAVGMSGSQKLAQAAGGVAAALAGLWVVAARHPGAARGLGAGAAPLAVALVGGLALNGTLYAELGRDLYWLLLAPAALLPLSARLKAPSVGLGASVLRALLIASPALVAGALALTRFEVEDTGGYY
jgi:hypothetical protein